MAMSMDLGWLDKGGLGGQSSLQDAISGGMQQNQLPTQLVVVPNSALQPSTTPAIPEAQNRGTLGVKDSTEGTLTKFGQKE